MHNEVQCIAQYREAYAQCMLGDGKLKEMIDSTLIGMSR